MTFTPVRHPCRRLRAMRACALAAVVWCTGTPTAWSDDAPVQELDCLVEPFQVIDVGSARGIVKSVAVDRSDTVNKSDVLVQLDDSEQAATVRQARARANMSGELKAREAALAFAQRKLERISELYSSDAISNFQRDEVQTELEMATQQLRQAEEARNLARLDLERAQIELARRTIRSPVDGIVIERFVSPGEFINDTPLVRVAQMNPLRIEAIAPSSMFGSVQPGMQAKINTATGSDAPLTATVTIVDRLIDPASGTFGIRLELPNPDYAIPSGLGCRLSLQPLSADTEQDTDTPARTTPESGAMRAAAPPAVTAPKSWGKATAGGWTDKPAGKNASRTATPSTAPSKATVGETGPALPEPTLGSPKQLRMASLLTEPGTDASCVTLGPIDDKRLWRKLQLALAAEPVAVTARTAAAGGNVIGHFVLTARAPSIGEARQIGQRLREQGIGDVAILTRPPYENRVSLGLYSKLGNAAERKTQVDGLKLGIATEVLPRFGADAAHWLDITAAADVLEAKPWSALAPNLDAVACDDVRYVAEAKADAR